MARRVQGNGGEMRVHPGVDAGHGRRRRSRRRRGSRSRAPPARAPELMSDGERAIYGSQTPAYSAVGGGIR